jgi:hypothetical protein
VGGKTGTKRESLALAGLGNVDRQVTTNRE